YDGLLRAAVGGFSPASDTDRYLIVLSDGEAQDEAWRKQLPALKEKGIHVIALGVGTTAGGFIPDVKTGAYLKDQRGAVVLSKLEPATLQALAFETAGTYRDASAWVDLAAVLQETVERGRQGVFGDKREARAIERFQWFLFPALLAALLGVWREIPVRPRPRVIRTTAGARAMPAIPRVAARTVARAGALLVIAALASTLAPRLRAAVADTTPTDTVDKLRATVTRLAAVDAVAPAGWKAMAEQTLALGQELLQAKQPLEPGLVRDALAAVDQGEARDPRAADWKKLREDLQRLLEPPQQQPQPDEQQKQDQQQKKDSQDQQQQSGQQGEPKDEKSKEKQQEQSDQQKQDQKQQQQAQKQDSALGDLEKPPELQPQPQPQSTPQKPQTRKFGGKQDTEQKQTSTDPELAAALARLEQVQENDSPARLHQRIEEEARRQEKQGPAPANPHDW
ncbi:MAG: hypothetical protein IAE82_09715, partial [Opitutaceae bacterium]|nr:hypothetical protein [Opitutaceae bacterium]